MINITKLQKMFIFRRPVYSPKATNQGGYEVSTIRVNPYNGRVWIACGCYGYEIFDPPYDSSLLRNKKLKNHEIKYIYNDKQVNKVSIKNDGKHYFVYDEDGLTFVSWYQDKELTNEFPNGSNVYQSMTLYAKMEKSIRIKFYDKNELLWEMDLDQYNQTDETQIPIRAGYVFAGWYFDQTLDTKIEFSNIIGDGNVYTGWHKIISNIEIGSKDIGGYIRYSDLTLLGAIEVDDTENVDNLCIHLEADTDSTYLIRFKMDTRFRMGMKKT